MSAYRMADCTQKLHGDYKRRCRIGFISK